jgi:hypothetical protein
MLRCQLEDGEVLSINVAEELKRMDMPGDKSTSLPLRNPDSGATGVEDM